MAFHFGNTIVTDRLVMYLDAANRRSYPGSGTVWNDLTINNNSGSLINGPTFSSANSGNILCDGIDDYILYNSPTLTTFSIAITYSPLAFDTNPIIDRYNYILGSFGSNLFCRYNNNNSGNSILIANHGGTDFGAVDLNHIVGGVYNLVITFNDSNKAVQLYINSTLINSATYSTTLRFQDSRQLGATFNCRLYNYKVYNRVLSAQEVLHNYNALKARYNL